MMVDVIAGFVPVFFALLGYVRGILREVLYTGAVVGAWIGSGRLAEHFAPMLQAVGIPASSVPTLSKIAAGVAVFFVLSLVARGADRAIGRDREGEVKPWNRRLGTLAGLAIGVMVAVFLVALGDAFLQTFPKRSGPLAKELKQSYLRKQVAEVEAARRLHMTEFLKTVRNPKALERELSKQRQLRELLQDPEVRRLLREHEKQKAFADGQKSSGTSGSGTSPAPSGQDQAAPTLEGDPETMLGK